MDFALFAVILISINFSVAVFAGTLGVSGGLTPVNGTGTASETLKELLPQVQICFVPSFGRPFTGVGLTLS